MPQDAATVEQVAAALADAGQSAQKGAEGDSQAQAPGSQSEELAGKSTGTGELTLDAVKSIVLDTVKSALADYQNASSRSMQSQLDKRDSNLTKILQDRLAVVDQIAELAKAGGIDPKQSDALQSGVLVDALRKAMEGQGEEETEDEDGNEAEYQLSPEEQISEQGNWLAISLGLDYGDPELKLIKRNGTAEEYLTSIRDAGFKKYLRLTQEQEQGEQEKGSPARVPGLGPQGSPARKIRTVTDPDVLYELAAREVQNSQSRR